MKLKQKIQYLYLLIKEIRHFFKRMKTPKIGIQKTVEAILFKFRNRPHIFEQHTLKRGYQFIIQMISLTPLQIRIIKIISWLLCLYLSTFFNAQNIFFILSGIVFIFFNLGKRKPGQPSAYSVFNKDFKKIAGTFDPEQMLTGKSKKVSSKIFDEDEEKKAKMIDQFFKNQSKFGNKPCYCESGLKFKKCCLLKEKMDSRKDKEKVF